MEIISVGKLLCVMQPPVNQLLNIPPWLWLWVVMTLSVVTPSSAARARFYPLDDSSGSNAVAAAVGSWWSSASLAAGVLALVAVVGVIHFFSSMHGELMAPRPRKERAAAGTKRTEPSQENSRQYAYNDDEMDKATNHFDRKNVVGEGRAGIVYKGRLMSNEGNPIRVAVKRFHDTRILDLTIEAAVKDRVKNLVNKPHQNVVRVHGAFSKVGRRLCVVYAFMPEGSLEHLLIDPKASLSMARRSSIIRDVAEGLKHLHSHDIIHGSVKASNILLEDNFKRARVGDFHFWQGDHPSTAASGSRQKAAVYILPKSIRSKHTVTETDQPTQEMDIFCFGTVVLEVIGRVNGRNLDVVVGKTRQKGTTASGRHPNRDDEELAEWLLKVGRACSHQDPNKRPTSMEEVVEILARRRCLPN